MTPSTETRGQRHSVAVMLRARELRAAGWTLREVADMISQDGPRVSYSTVRLWCDEKAYVIHQAKRREWSRRHVAAIRNPRLGRADHTAEYQRFRVQQLIDEAGLTYENVCRIMEFDYPGSGWTRSRLVEMFGPSRERRAAA